MFDSPDEILDSEFVMRRLPAKMPWYDPLRGLMAEAFNPHKTSDEDGLSVSRMLTREHPEFLSPEALAETGLSRYGYFVAILSVKKLREAGLMIVRDPQPENPGHALIVNLRSDNRNSDEVAEWTQMLAERLTTEVQGPFVRSSEP